jgi:hypothetical protein
MNLTDWENPEKGVWWRKSQPKGIIICRVTHHGEDSMMSPERQGYHWQVGAIRQIMGTLENAKDAADSEIAWFNRKVPLGDEHGRIKFWRDSLDKNNPTKQDVVRSAASALAIRDKRIDDLQQQISQWNSRNYRRAEGSSWPEPQKAGCDLCGNLTCRGTCFK